MQLERIDTDLTALLIDLSPVIRPTLRELLGTLRAVRRIIERSSSNEQIFLGLNDERMRRAAQLKADLCQDLEASWGIRVLEASNAMEAIQIATSNPGVIDLLLTDLEMPKTSGFDCAHSIARLRPDISILCMSAGLSVEEWENNIQQLRSSSFQFPNSFSAGSSFGPSVAQTNAYQRSLRGASVQVH